MAIIQAVLAAVLRSAGKILNTAFGWATTMLFGRVPRERQLTLSIIAFGSVLWIVALLGIAFPGFATFLFTFVTLPKWVDRNWVRLAMLGVALLIPLVVGFLSMRMLDPESQPEGMAAKAKAVFQGYPYTMGVAITLLMMLLFAPVLKTRTLLRRWSIDHVPVIVAAEDYQEIVGEVQEALRAGGWETQREPASWMLRAPTKALTFFAGGPIEKMVAEQLTTLRAGDLEVELHPSDLVISGREEGVARARATIAEQLAFSKAYLTWDKEANEIEDRLEALWQEARSGGPELAPPAALARLEAIGRDLRALKIPYEEWETLFREMLLLERSLLQAMAGLTERPLETTEAEKAPAQADRASKLSQARQPPPLAPSPPVRIPRPVALLIAALLALLGIRPGGARRRAA